MEQNQLHNALHALKRLRSNTGLVFESLSHGLNNSDPAEESKYIFDLQDLLNIVNINLRDLEQCVAQLNAPPGPFSLGNTTYLSQETTPERQALYGQLVNSYKWTDKIHEYSSLAVTHFSQNSLKRSYSSYTTAGNAKRRRAQTIHNVSPEFVDNLMLSIDRTYNDMTITPTRPFTSNTILQISLGRVLKAMVVLKGLIIEWVMIRGYNEQLDLWNESRYKVFQKVTENAHAGMLHFSSPTLPDLSVRTFMTWLNSFSSLFNAPCKRCGSVLQGAMPPTWRDFRTLDPFHEQCRR